jgi:hypothetical protein
MRGRSIFGAVNPLSTHNPSQFVFNRCPVPVAASNDSKITLGSHLGRRNNIVATRQSPAAAVPEKSMISQVVIIVAEDVGHHSAPELAQISSWLRPQAPQLIGYLMSIPYCRRRSSDTGRQNLRFGKNDFGATLGGSVRIPRF